MDSTSGSSFGNKRDSSTEEKENRILMSLPLKEGGAEESDRLEDARGKSQKVQGRFTGEISLQPREEEWMLTDVPRNNDEKRGISYREAVKPKTAQEKRKKRKRDKKCGMEA